MLEIILVRHGETESNINKTYCGWTDISLNERGIEQARCAAGKLESSNIDGIFSSPLKRTLETAQIINNNFKLDIVCSDDIKERNFGCWDNLTYQQIFKDYPEELKLWEQDWLNYCMNGGESALHAHRRVAGFADRLVEECSGSILIVTHLGSIRSIISHMLGLGIEGTWRFRVDNGSISRIMVNAEGYAYLTALNA